MAAKLFRLRDVPDDEAEEIRRLLVDHEIEFYETCAGGWGISVPAIWLYDESRLDEARALIAAYQQQRTEQARKLHQQQKDEGQHQTVWHKLKQHPLQALLFVGMALFILFVTLSPFLNFGK